MVQRTLDRMAGGGIYDQIGGGFHRYAVDRPGWCPISRRCSTTTPSSPRLPGRLSKYGDRYRQVAEETLDYVRAR